jgi:hypothetical protein
MLTFVCAQGSHIGSISSHIIAIHRTEGGAVAAPPPAALQLVSRPQDRRRCGVASPPPSFASASAAPFTSQRCARFKMRQLMYARRCFTRPPPFHPRCSGTLGRWRRATVQPLLSRFPLRICRTSSLAFASGGMPRLVCSVSAPFPACPCFPPLVQHRQRRREPAYVDKNAHGKLFGVSVHGHHSGPHHPLTYPAAAAARV